MLSDYVYQSPVYQTWYFLVKTVNYFPVCICVVSILLRE
jgi:hypothetical protein